MVEYLIGAGKKTEKKKRYNKKQNDFKNARSGTGRGDVQMFQVSYKNTHWWHG